MGKRKSIPENAAGLYSSTANKAADQVEKKSGEGEGLKNPATSSTVKTKEGEDGILRQRVTADVPVEVAEAARNAVFFTPGMTLRDLLTSALEKEVQRMEKERGEAFPQRGKALKRGRRA